MGSVAQDYPKGPDVCWKPPQHAVGIPLRLLKICSVLAPRSWSWKTPPFWQRAQTREAQAGLSAPTCSYRSVQRVQKNPTGKLWDPAREVRPGKPAQVLRGDLELARHRGWEEWWEHSFRARGLCQVAPLPKRPSTSPRPLSSFKSPPKRRFKKGNLSSLSHAGVVDMFTIVSLGPRPMLGLQ